jgi:hypothetical protein
MSAKRSEYCFICNEELSTKFNWERHLKSTAHLTRKSTHDQDTIIHKKEDYTIDNFIPLNVNSNDRQFHKYYFTHPIKFTNPKDPISVMKTLLLLFIEFHQLDQEGYLPPFLIREVIQPKAEKKAYITRTTQQFSVDIPKIVDDKVEWISYDKNLVNWIENQLECYYAVNALTEMIRNDMQEVADDSVLEYDTLRSTEIKSCYSFLGSNGFLKKQLNRNFCDCFRINHNYMDYKPTPN